MTRNPSSLSTLKKLSYERPNLPDVLFLIDYLKNVEDRAAAIIATSSVEESLEDAISTKMVQLNSTEYGELFRGQAPLANFQPKIALGYALELFENKRAKILISSE